MWETVKLWYKNFDKYGFKIGGLAPYFVI
jgi:hypothetical protein